MHAQSRISRSFRQLQDTEDTKQRRNARVPLLFRLPPGKSEQLCVHSRSEFLIRTAEACGGGRSMVLQGTAPMNPPSGTRIAHTRCEGGEAVRGPLDIVL